MLMADSIQEAEAKLQKALVPLRDNLRKLDDQFIDDIAHGKLISDDVLQSWYLQHLLYLAVTQFAAQKEITIPKYVGRWEFCFGTKDPVMNDIWRELINRQNVDEKILKPAYDRLQQALKTQLVPVQITDEITQWRLTPKII